MGIFEVINAAKELAGKLVSQTRHHRWHVWKTCQAQTSGLSGWKEETCMVSICDVQTFAWRTCTWLT